MVVTNNLLDVKYIFVMAFVKLFNFAIILIFPILIGESLAQYQHQHHQQNPYHQQNQQNPYYQPNQYGYQHPPPPPPARQEFTSEMYLALAAGLLALGYIIYNLSQRSQQHEMNQVQLAANQQAQEKVLQQTRLENQISSKFQII